MHFSFFADKGRISRSITGIISCAYIGMCIGGFRSLTVIDVVFDLRNVVDIIIGVCVRWDRGIIWRWIMRVISLNGDMVGRLSIKMFVSIVINSFS